MRRVLSLGFLLLFIFSTTATYATVHHCKGEVTDVSLLSLASCDHDDMVDMHCHNTCCDDKEKKRQKRKKCDEAEKDCCDTQKVAAVEMFVTPQVSSDDMQLISKVLPSFYDFYFEHPKVLYRTFGIAYVPPNIKRNITIEVACFRI
ncbi:MAG: hypothetical protein HUJ25_04040 [Crocinitomicaceae bacterium]|nr:hypothetical protein [Crocinitomicaceae bacterium]